MTLAGIRLSAWTMALAVASGTAWAQGGAPPEVAWESVGPDSAKVEALALVNPVDGAAHGMDHPAFATLDFPNVPGYYKYSDGVYRLHDPVGGGAPPEDDPAWTLVTDRDEPDGLYVEASGLVLAASGSGAHPLSRSTDGGATWSDVATDACGGDGVAPTLVRTTGPGRDGTLWLPGDLCRSDDRGATWLPVEHTAPPYLERFGLLELPPSDAAPDGRLVLAVGGGLLVSADGGATWGASSLYEYGRWVGRSLALVADAAHPYGGVAYALASDFLFEGGATVVALASDDGGTTWEERHRFVYGELGLGRIAGNPDVVALGDGSLVAGLLMGRGGTRRDYGLVVWSGDGGRTWAPLGGAPPWLGSAPPDGACGPPGSGPACEGGAWPGWGPAHLAVDRSGRVWAATDNGVWRTAGPAWAVASDEPRGPEPVGLNVSVRPNPAAGRVEVAVRGAASRPVRVVVLDALGREVAVVWDGPVRAGQRLEASTAGLAPGAYVVRAVSERGASTAPLVVAR